MLWIIRRIKFIFSPKDVRSEFYAYFYPLVFGGGQLSMVITACWPIITTGSICTTS